MKRELTEHRVNPANDKLTITVEDAPGAGGAQHWLQQRTLERMRRGVEGTHGL